jgi:hypothetical protein
MPVDPWDVTSLGLGRGGEDETYYLRYRGMCYLETNTAVFPKPLLEHPQFFHLIDVF